LEVGTLLGRLRHHAKTDRRWFYWLITIFSGFGCLLAFFCLPETRYSRSPMLVRGQVVRTNAFGVTHILSDEEAREIGAFDAHNSAALDSLSSTEKRSFVSTLNPVSSVGELGNGRPVLGDIPADIGTGASFGIVPMVHTWNYLTAYMVVSLEFDSHPQCQCTES
jgi:hypothetical protein